MMKMRTRKSAAMVDSGSAIQAETSKHAYMAAHVAKNPPNDVVSCAKLRAKIGDWRMSGSFCVAIAFKDMLASSPTSWSERDAHSGPAHGQPGCSVAFTSSKLRTARAAAVGPVE